MGIPRVKVVNPNEGWMGTEYYIDGKKIERVKSVDFRVAVDEVPHFTFETMGLPDIDMSGDIRFKFTPKTVQQAIIVLRNELMTHGELYQVFLKSMLSSLDDKFWNSRSKSGHELDLGEAGDICWYLAMLCESFGWSLDEIMQMNVEKLKARYPDGFDIERANHRMDGDI